MASTGNSSSRPTLPQWKSRFGFMMAATGAAVGLGNIWKFPYVAGAHGGSAFFLVYIACLIFIGIPILKAEVIIGRLGRRNQVDTLSTLAQASHSKYSSTWPLLGWLGLLILTMVLAFYSVVAGWSIAYIAHAFNGAFKGLNPSQVQNLWEQTLSDPLSLCLWHALFMILTLGVVAKGVQKGIEASNKILMPLLFLVLLLLVAVATQSGHFIEGMLFLLKPDFTKITLAVLLDAVGQAFFSLALGAGCMLVYGAYLPKDGTINASLNGIAWLNVLVALLAGLSIFPLVFAYNLSPEGGPGLVYKVLPLVFGQIPFGSILGTLFFVLLLFAAWTSSLSMAEPLVLLLIEKLKLKRGMAALAIGLLAFIFGLGTVFSFNIASHVRLLGFSLYDVLVEFPTTLLLPLGGLGYAIFAGWVLPKSRYQEGFGAPVGTVHYFLIKYIAPLGIMLILGSNLGFI